MSDERRGVVYRQGGLMRVDNGRVERVAVRNRSQGAVLISYAVYGPGSMVFSEWLWLQVHERTPVFSAFGHPISLRELRPGVWVDAIFSPRMTRRIPPRSAAFFLGVQQATQSPAAVQVTIGPMAGVSREEGILCLGDPRDASRQRWFGLTEVTVFWGPERETVVPSSLRPGQQIRVIHRTGWEDSRPPRQTAILIQRL